MQHDSFKKTIVVAFLLCVICSVLVSVATVSLKDLQEQNKKLDIQKNLLSIAGLTSNNPSKEEIKEAFSHIESRIIDLKTGNFLESISPIDFNYKEAQQDSRYVENISPEFDLAGIKMRSKYSKIYAVKSNGLIAKYIFPIHGKGLWSTLWGFVALSADTLTIEGLGFYQHGETPGLGGEVDNPKWKKLWIGKKPFDDNFEPIIRVIKGRVTKNTPNYESKVDGLSGASLTSAGVQNLVNYWLGDHGYGPFLSKLRHKKQNKTGANL